MKNPNTERTAWPQKTVGQNLVSKIGRTSSKLTRTVASLPYQSANATQGKPGKS